MAHNLATAKDGAPMMAYAGTEPWHGLGTKVDGLMTAKEAISKAGLDWKLHELPVFTGAMSGRVDGWKALQRSDNDEIIHIARDSYKVIQNREAFSFFDSVVKDGAAKYETAGGLGKGERIWMMANIPNPIVVNKNDVIEKNLLLTNSHDGTSSLLMMFTPERVVCQNTLNMAIKGRTGGIAIRHTANAMGRIEEAQRALGLAVKFYDTVQDQFQFLASKMFTLDKLNRYVEEIFPGKDADSTRASNIRTEVLNKVHGGKGNGDGSWWSAYNGVTEYVDHGRGTRGTSEVERASNRLSSIWFGSGARLKEKAFSLALSMAT